MDKVRVALPTAAIVYAADYAGLPYGEKSDMEVATRVCALLGLLSERYKPRLAVIACNTASVITLSHVRAVLGLPVVGTVPAIKPAFEMTRSGVIGLLGTKATIRQPYTDRLEANFAQGMTMLRHAAPALVHAAETKLRGSVPNPDDAQSAIRGLVSQPNGENIDTVVLGCTHFPLVEEELAKAAQILGHRHSISFVDGSDGIARRVLALTQDQPWPDKPVPSIFLTTGELPQIARYGPALRDHGFGSVISV
jgi:glutamate racemase